MHWDLGQFEMVRRAGATPFSMEASSSYAHPHSTSTPSTTVSAAPSTPLAHQRISLTELFSEIDRVLLFGKDMDLQKSLSSLGDKVHFFEDMEDATIDSVTYPLILAAICRPLGMTEWLFASDGDAELLIPKLVSRGMQAVLVQGIGQQSQTSLEKLAECVAECGVSVVDWNSPHIRQEIQDAREGAEKDAVAMRQSLGGSMFCRAFSLGNRLVT